MSEVPGTAGRFDHTVGAWKSGLGTVRDRVRQELVRRQLELHLPAGRLRVLDAGCGQGTQAIALARLGHDVTGIDLSADLLATAQAAVASEPDADRWTLRLIEADLLDLGGAYDGQYDVVCCHGVAMYLPSLAGAVRALVRTVRPGGVVSLLTRNRAGLAMRAAMTGEWSAALGAFDARCYRNRLGVAAVRADEPAEVQAAMRDEGAATLAWYGVRLFTDHWDLVPPPEDFPTILAVEEEAGRRDPYRSAAALTHTVGRRDPSGG